MVTLRIPNSIIWWMIILVLKISLIKADDPELPACNFESNACTPGSAMTIKSGSYCINSNVLYKLSADATKAAARKRGIINYNSKYYSKDNQNYSSKSNLEKRDDTPGACAAITNPDGDYFFQKPTDDSTNDFVMATTEITFGYTYSSSTYTKITLAAGVYVNNFDSSTAKTSKELSKALVKCSDTDASKCTLADGVSGEHYLSLTDANGLITCDSNKCKSITNIDGYYIDSSDTKKIIKCVSGDSAKCESAASENGDVYIDSGKTDSTKPLIKCTASGCELASAKDQDVYLNKGSDNSGIKEIIKCTSNGSSVNCKSEVFDTNKITYFIDAAKSDSSIPLIKCDPAVAVAKCELVASSGSTNSYYLNGNQTSLLNALIVCQGSSCSIKDATLTQANAEYYINNAAADKADTLIKCSGSKCEIVANTATSDIYYINKGESGFVIKCSSESKCTSEQGQAFGYYVDTATTNNVISCSGDSAACTTSTGLKQGKYIDATNNKNLITCSSSGCISEASTVGYYINAGRNEKEKKSLIRCSDEKCEYVDGVQNKAYINSGNEESKYIITCSSASLCDFTKQVMNKYYINAAVTSVATDGLILCSENQNTISCTAKEGRNGGYYLSAINISPLVYCDTNECKFIKVKAATYYPNMNNYDSSTKKYSGEDALVFCESDVKCVTKDVTEAESYFVNSASTDVKKSGIIKCTKSSSSIECVELTVNNGYYINSGSDNATNKSIYYDGTVCKTIAIKPGYYHSGEDYTKVILYDGETIEVKALSACPNGTDNKKAMSSGNVCIDTKKVLNFAYDNIDFSKVTNTTKSFNLTSADDTSLYYYVSTSNFPGSIGTTIATLFEVSKYYISRVIQDGSLAISNTSHLLTTSTSVGVIKLSSETSLYECKESTKLCVLKSECSTKVYMIDLTTGKGILCNGSEISIISASGYYIDGGRTVGSNTPNVLKCNGLGICETITPKSSTYFINAGLNSNTNKLIYCNGVTCSISKAEVGYYVGMNGLLHCTSETACSEETPNNNVYYINTGSEKNSYKLIICKKNVCTAVTAGSGYYLTKSQSVLINCESNSSCSEINAIESVYSHGDAELSSKYIINCTKNSNGDIVCETEPKGEGFYIGENGMLINTISSGSGKSVNKPASEGVYRSAKKTVFSLFRSEDGSFDPESETMVNSKQRASGGTMSYNLINCNENGCTELTSSQLAAVPICTFNNNKCEILAAYARFKTSTTVITAGGYCTSTDRSQLYFATNAISVENDFVTSSITENNCIEVSSKYSTKYFTVDDYNIYHIDNGEISKITSPGYYFINTSTNELASGDISNYNESSIAIYKCNNKNCVRVANPTSETYYADINKKIIKYSVLNQAFVYAFSKDVKCEYTNGSCTVDSDLEDKEFCINYKGELVLPQKDIKNKESGKCYKSTSASVSIYGFAQFLYTMDAYSARKINVSGYYLVNKSTNVMANYKDTAGAEDAMLLYGCNNSVCKIYEPEKDIYYYDVVSQLLFKYNGNDDWETLVKSGYAYIATNPNEKYVYQINIDSDGKVTIGSKVDYGYYYTIDGEMYECSNDSNECTTISESDYYFTESGELFKCIYDSEEIEKTECTQISCIFDQYYFMVNKYYECKKNGVLEEVSNKYCYYDTNVIINYPMIYEDSWPNLVKESVEGIVKNNNSTAITKTGKSIEVIPGIFTNCTYDSEEEEISFDMICINNFVKYDEDLEIAEICSISNLGYVECMEDPENPNKCNTSGSSTLTNHLYLYIIMSALSLLFINLF